MIEANERKEKIKGEDCAVLMLKRFALPVLCIVGVSFSAHAQFMRGMKEATSKQLSRPPEIKPLPRATSKLYITVRGKTFPGGFVVVKGGSSVAYVMAHPVTGEFEVDVFLKPEAVNKLEIKAIDRRGRMTPPAFVEVEQTLTPAEAPVIYDYEKYTNKNLVKIKGRTRSGYEVVAYGGKYPAKSRADENGEFTIAVYLHPNSLNRIRIAAIDKVGNMSPFNEARIVHDSIPPYPPAVTRYPTKTRKTTVEIAGTAEPKATVVFEGTIKRQELEVDEFGHFKGTIKIEKFALSNRPNRILVYAVDQAGNRSKPTEIIITHVHFFRKHMVHIMPGFHIFPNSPFLEYLNISSGSTIGPAVAGSYDFVFKAPFSIGAEFGMYSSTGNTASEEFRIFKLYTLGWYFLVKPAFHLMLEKFDIFLKVGGGFLMIHKFIKTEQAGGPSLTIESYPTWMVKISVGLDYYISDFLSVGFEEAYVISFVKNFSEVGHTFDAGGNIFYLTTGLHF